MTTTTRPRAKPAAKSPPMSADERQAKARKHIAAVKREIATIKADGTAAPSTITHRVKSKKAQGFDRLEDIVAGKD